MRLALQAVGRKLGMYLRRRLRVKQEGERRNIFLRYLGEVATAVSGINQSDRDSLYNQLLLVAKKKTAQADMEFDENGKPVEDEGTRFGRERADRRSQSRRRSTAETSSDRRTATNDGLMRRDKPQKRLHADCHASHLQAKTPQ